MSTKHTPGPWTFEKVTKPTRYFEVHIPGDHPIAVGRSGGPDDVHACDEANARLVAAAPEMLEALKAVDGYFEPNPKGVPAWLKQVRAAIAKADGK